jgi:thioredoxin-like negative regulator of GroEL
MSVNRAHAAEEGLRNAPVIDPIDPIGTVKDATFAQLVLEGRGRIAVEFMSYGCGHCRQLEPVLREVATMLGDQVCCFRVNIALEHTLANDYQITGTPTIVMFSGGKEVGRVEGPEPSTATLLAAIRQPFGL